MLEGPLFRENNSAQPIPYWNVSQIIFSGLVSFASFPSTLGPRQTRLGAAELKEKKPGVGWLFALGTTDHGNFISLKSYA